MATEIAHFGHVQPVVLLNFRLEMVHRQLGIWVRVSGP